MKCLVIEGIVSQIVEDADVFELHSGFQWVDCDSSVQENWLYDGSSFSNPFIRSLEELLEELRTVRNSMLSETDYWNAPDTPDMTSEQTVYRQALRDITNTYTSLDDVVWPTKP